MATRDPGGPPQAPRTRPGGDGGGGSARTQDAGGHTEMSEDGVSLPGGIYEGLGGKA